MGHPATGTVATGDVVDLAVGEAVHGGWCVARPAAGGQLVVLVRHALPGERVRARVTSTTARFARAEAIDVVDAAPERVAAPCPYAGPGGCGGCDWQHAGLAAQRALKGRVVSQQLSRIAGIERDVSVAEVPGDSGGLGWRSRVRFAVDDSGRAGLHRHRSHQIVAITDCLIAHPLVREAAVTRQAWPGARWVDVATAPATGQRAVLVRGGRGVRPAPHHLTHRAAGRDWRVAAAGFWQVHPGAADVLAAAVTAGLGPARGETALDLFCGAGLFAGVLAASVGPDGVVVGVERDAAAVRDARANLRQTPWARVHRGDVGDVLAEIGTAGAAVAVADPPRTGLSGSVIDALCQQAGQQGLRRIAYVSCDPATLARDIAAFGRHGWSLADLRAFDAFPMTHHIECVAVLRPPG